MENSSSVTLYIMEVSLLFVLLCYLIKHKPILKNKKEDEPQDKKSHWIKKLGSALIHILDIRKFVEDNEINLLIAIVRVVFIIFCVAEVGLTIHAAVHNNIDVPNAVFAILIYLVLTFIAYIIYPKIVVICSVYFSTVKQVSKEWQIVADTILAIITTYIIRIFRTPISGCFEAILSGLRIILLLWLAFLLIKLLFSIVVEAIKYGLKGRHLPVLKFVFCILFMQIAVYSAVMIEGLVLSSKTPSELPKFQYNDSSDVLNNIENDFYLSKDINSNINNPSTTNVGSREINITKELLTVLYYVVITFTSVGYGDIYPLTLLSKIFAGIISLSGYITSAVVIAVLLSGLGGPDKSTSYINTADTDSTEYAAWSPWKPFAAGIALIIGIIIFVNCK